MASVRPDESELNRVFNALRLVFAAQAGKSDPVVDALRVVVMSDVQHDTLFSTVKQKPGGDIAYQEFRATPPPPCGCGIHFCDRGDALRVPRDRANRRNDPVGVVDPYLAFGDQLTRFYPRIFDGEGEKDSVVGEFFAELGDGLQIMQRCAAQDVSLG